MNIEASEAQVNASQALINSELGQTLIANAEEAIMKASLGGAHSTVVYMNHIFNTKEDTFTAGDFQHVFYKYFSEYGFRVDFHFGYNKDSKSYVIILW